MLQEMQFQNALRPVKIINGQNAAGIDQRKLAYAVLWNRGSLHIHGILFF